MFWKCVAAGAFWWGDALFLNCWIVCFWMFEAFDLFDSIKTRITYNSSNTSFLRPRTMWIVFLSYFFFGRPERRRFPYLLNPVDQTQLKIVCFSRNHAYFPRNHSYFPEIMHIFQKSCIIFQKSCIFSKKSCIFSQKSTLFHRSHAYFYRNHAYFPESIHISKKSCRCFQKSYIFSQK